MHDETLTFQIIFQVFEHPHSVPPFLFFRLYYVGALNRKTKADTIRINELFILKPQYWFKIFMSM